MYRTYSELITFKTFEERFEYLKCSGHVSYSTFGGHRMLNQYLYKNPMWLGARSRAIIRDRGCDLGIEDRPINPNDIARVMIIVHHINPITIDQVLSNDPCVFSLDNLITTSDQTHKAIHYGSVDSLMPSRPNERFHGDHCPWIR